MRLLRLVCVLSVSILATGCFNFGMVVRLKPDGTGTIEETMLVNTQALAKVAGLMGGGAGGHAESPLAAMGPEEWKAQAERLGATLVSVDKITASGGFEGVKAIFAFDDITKVKLTPDLGGLTGATGGIAASSPLEPPVNVTFSKGPPAVLTVAMQESSTTGVPAPADTTAAPSPLDNPMLVAMIKEMFKGARLGIDLDVAGTILKTNADHVTGSRVTLLELDLGALLEQDAQLKHLQSLIKPGMSFAQLKPLFKGIKGVKVNDPVVTVEFR